MRQRPLEETDTVVLDQEYGESRASVASLVGELERSLAERTLELPSLPEVVLKIRSTLADENVSVSEIARVLGTDPALAARILRVANSAMFYRGGRRITSLGEAVSQLGHKMVRNVALSFAAQQAFIGYGNRPLREYVGNVWRHSVHAAVLAYALARSRTLINPDEAFLAGLLHEVGKLYILIRAQEHLEELVAEEAFQSVLMAWHPRIGRAVIEAWELSPELAAAVGEHELGSLAAPDPPTMTSIVAVANYLAEHSEEACNDPEFHARAPDFGTLASDKASFDTMIRSADVDVRLLIIAFGV
jgi:HD-like signal output (HDOD) protein